MRTTAVNRQSRRSPMPSIAARLAVVTMLSVGLVAGLSRNTARADSNKPATPPASGRPEPSVPTKTKRPTRPKARPKPPVTKAPTTKPPATKPPVPKKKKRTTPADNVSVAFCNDFLRLSGDAGFSEATRVLSDSTALDADRPKAKAAVHSVVVALGGLQFNAPDAILEDLVTLTTFFQNAEAFVDRLIANDPSAGQLAAQITAALPEVNSATARITAFTDRVC